MKIGKILLTITSIILFVVLTSYTIFSNIELNKQITELSNKNADQNAKQNQENIETANELQEHNDDILALQKDLANAEVDIISLQKYIDTTENRIRDIKTELDNNIKNLSGLENVHHSLQNAEIEKLQAELQEQKHTLNLLKNEINKLIEYKTTIEDLKDKINRLEDNKEETKTIKLTKYNYKNYLAFNVTFDELQQNELYDIFPETDEIYYTCRMTIETYANQPNISFYDTTIEYSLYMSSCETFILDQWYCASTDIFDQTVDIAYDGYSKTTFYMIFYPYIEENHATTVPTFPSTSSTLSEIRTITGNVIITE
ncbi:MAG: hypothetical protein E7605_04035 [Ruminococcaceae bacterium]|nr:hypothetical protein [Oscillospiraceae bacterium]